MFSILDRAGRRSGAMMDALGVDPDVAMMRGDLPPAEIPRIAQRCASCDAGAECERWLDAPDAGRDRAPDYCRNRALFDRLTR